MAAAANRAAPGTAQVAECCFDYLYIEIVAATVAPEDLTPEGRLSEAACLRLEGLGYDVGYRFVERCTRDRSRLPERLEIIKFICKDFWSQLFHKNVDKLQTNHRGVYVLQDNNFRLLQRISCGTPEETRQQAAPFLAFPCGLLRGALANLGVTAVVTADISTVPACSFNVKIKT